MATADTHTVLLVEDDDATRARLARAVEESPDLTLVGAAGSCAAARAALDEHVPDVLLVDLGPTGVSGKRAARALDRAGLELNYNTVPFDPRKPFDPSGIRLGTPAVTSRGMGPGVMRQIAAWIGRGVEAAKRGDEAALDRIAGEVREVTAGFPAPGLAHLVR